MINQVSSNLAVLSTLDGDAVAVSFSHRDKLANKTEKISYKGQKEGIPIRFWGNDNNLPFYREQIVGDNNIVGTLLATKRDITFGTGIFAYKNEFISDKGKVNIREVPIPDAAKAFFDKVDIDEYLISALKEYFMHGNVFTEFTRTNDEEIDRMALHECKYVRLGEQNDAGRILNGYISGAWATDSFRKDGETVYDRRIFPVALYDASKKQAKFLLHTGDRFLNDGYYNQPTWWGSRPWIELANSIPLFHQANIKNGYTIRFHIEIPKGYFIVDPASQADEDIKKAKDATEQKKGEILEALNKMLSGVDNTGRVFFSEYEFNAVMAKEYPGIRINPINVDIKDESLLKLFEKSNTAVTSSQGVHPTLANFETQGKLASGSEIRNAFIMYLAIKTPIPRRIILKAINLVKRENKWPEDIFFGFGDTEITTLDESKSGMNEDAAVVPENNS